MSHNADQLINILQNLNIEKNKKRTFIGMIKKDKSQIESVLKHLENRYLISITNDTYSVNHESLTFFNLVNKYFEELDDNYNYGIDILNTSDTEIYFRWKDKIFVATRGTDFYSIYYNEDIKFTVNFDGYIFEMNHI